MDKNHLVKIEDLAKRAKKGDSEAFGQLFQKLSEQIYRYAYLKTHSEEEAKDVTSETFRRVWSYINSYKSNNFRAYLYRIAHNLIIDNLVKETKKRTSSLEYLEGKAEPDTNLEKLEKKEKVERLMQMMKKLPENYYNIIYLRFIEEFSIKETASILGIPQITVRVYQHRALAKLKQLLK